MFSHSLCMKLAKSKLSLYKAVAVDILKYNNWDENISHTQWRTQKEQDGAFKDLEFFGLISMMIFLSILVVGFAYEWAKGALDWE